MNKNSPEDTIGEVNNTQSNVKFHYTWKIINFSGIMYNSHKISYDSPMISTKTKPEYHFKLKIMPHYKGKEDFGIGLISHNNTALEINSSVSIINTNIGWTSTKHTSTAVYNIKNFGWTILTSKISDVEKILINDEITILCEIGIDMNSKCNKHLTDVNIIIKDEKFLVHKNILANSSNVFAAMFKHDMKENQENLIEIKDIDCSTFHHLLQYIYLEIGVTNENSIKILAAADKYAIEELKNICENNLCKNITLTNVFEYLNVADMYILNKLKKETIAFIKLHKSQLVEKKLVHSIVDLPKDVLIEVFSAM